MLVSALRRRRWLCSVLFALVIFNFAIVIITTSFRNLLPQQHLIPTIIKDFGNSNDTNSQNEKAGNPFFDFGKPFLPHDLSAPAIRTNVSRSWGHDLNEPTGESLGKIRIDHPRLFAANHRWR